MANHTFCLNQGGFLAKSEIIGGQNFCKPSVQNLIDHLPILHDQDDLDTMAFETFNDFLENKNCRNVNRDNTLAIKYDAFNPL